MICDPLQDPRESDARFSKNSNRLLPHSVLQNCLFILFLTSLLRHNNTVETIAISQIKTINIARADSREIINVNSLVKWKTRFVLFIYLNSRD